MRLPYDIHQHRHRFAIWAAARAAQRGMKGATVDAIGGAIDVSPIPDVARGIICAPTTPDAFDDEHKKWCNGLLQSLGWDVTRNYGRAAKIVAVYLKAMVVVPHHETDLPFIKVIHPPIDRILLQAVSGDKRFHEDLCRCCRMTNWTQLREEAYFTLIGALRGLAPEGFWMLEEYWDPKRSDADQESAG